MDFVSDQFSHCGCFRALLIIDVFTRKCQAIERRQSLRSEDVVRVLRNIVITRGVAKPIYRDNGSVFLGRILDLWAYINLITLDLSCTGKSRDTAFIELFIGSLCDKCINVYWFADLTDAKEKLQACQVGYNENLSRRALNNRSSSEFAYHWTINSQKLHKQWSKDPGGLKWCYLPQLKWDTCGGKVSQHNFSRNKGC